MLKVLYYGGQKSGKSILAEKKALNLAKNKKPYYIATYNSSYGDSEMLDRVLKHKKEREDKFNTIEESLNLVECIRERETYLIDCISMWILNSIDRSESELLREIEEIGKIKANIVFVLNSVNEGVSPLDKESRRFIDLTGIIGQKLASISDEVYDVKLGIESRLK